MIGIVGRMRASRVVERLERYRASCEELYDRNHGDDDASSEERAYQKGRCIGFLYALAQVKRKDLTRGEAEDLLAKYRFEATAEDLEGVYSFLRTQERCERPGACLLADIPRQGRASEKFRQGFVDAMEISRRLLDDTYNYMSFFELVIAVVKKGR